MQTESGSWESWTEPSGPTPIGETLNQMASRLRVPRTHVLATVFETWEELVGSVIAAHTSPVRLVDGDLVVAVDDPVWATEMKFFGAELIGRINTAAGEEAVTSLTVRVRPR